MRTRAAAAKLVTAGHPAHAITVDLIYAEIKQGSRTTINDELKLWKDEQAKVNALSAALPDAVANAMLATWAVAIEHGEKVFEQRREEIESELTTTAARAQASEASLGEQCARAEQLSLLLGQSTERETAQRDEIQALRDAKDEALRRAVLAERETASERAEAQARESTLKSIHEKELTDARAELATKEVELRSELMRTTERLEGVQKHVMLQVADARDAQKRAEDLATMAAQRAEKFSDELAAQRAQLTEVSSQLVRAVAAHTAAVDDANGMRSERELLKEKLAIATGQLQAMTKQVEALSRHLSGGRKAAPTSSRSTPSATNSTKNIKA
jgi:hypothetical protein